MIAVVLFVQSEKDFELRRMRTEEKRREERRRSRLGWVSFSEKELRSI
jgi:hypothetical protein